MIGQGSVRSSRWARVVVMMRELECQRQTDILILGVSP